MALYCRQGQAVELEDEGDELNGADNDAVSYFAPRAAEYLLMEEQEHDGGGQEEAGAHDAEGDREDKASFDAIKPPPQMTATRRRARSAASILSRGVRDRFMKTPLY